MAEKEISNIIKLQIEAAKATPAPPVGPALEGSNLPLGISEYELSKLYPKKVDGTIPTIEEIEAKLGNKDKS